MYKSFLFHISKLDSKSDLCHVNSYMLCEVNLMLVSFAASVALERSIARVLLHVLLQITRRSASIVALVTLERPFSCVDPHHVLFQMGRCNAGKLAR